MGKFTEGTWEVEDDLVFTTKPMKANLICVQPDPEFCRESCENWEANAKLIAAAPDLLKALIPFANFFEKDFENSEFITITIEAKIADIIAAKQAIIRATE